MFFLGSHVSFGRCIYICSSLYWLVMNLVLSCACRVVILQNLDIGWFLLCVFPERLYRSLPGVMMFHLFLFDLGLRKDCFNSMEHSPTGNIGVTIQHITYIRLVKNRCWTSWYVVYLISQYFRVFYSSFMHPSSCRILYIKSLIIVDLVHLYT